MKKAPVREKKLTFWTKDEIACPACKHKFKRERLLSGSGRLIAGPLTDELQRTYKPGKLFGTVYPTIYVVTVCPNCFYASLIADFPNLDPSVAEKVKLGGQGRKANIMKFFKDVDFAEPATRTLHSGTTAYILAIDCYSHHDKYAAPTIKKAICSLRAAWLFKELKEELKAYEKMELFFYKKALQYYREALQKMQTGGEEFGNVNMGPDVDKNFGYEGVLYLNGILTLKYGEFEEPDELKRLEKYEGCKRMLSRLFGDGKSSKDRPSAILDMTRDIYDKLNEIITQIQEKYNITDSGPPIVEESSEGDSTE